MLENPNSSDSSNVATSTIRRYAPPNQRNRSLGRRKSGGDKLERSSIYAIDGDKNQIAASRNVPVVDHKDAANSTFVNESPHARLISLQGCCGSEAYQLLNDRWAAAVNAYTNPSIDLAERPVMYSGSGASAWGHFRLPHQLIHQSASVGPSGSQMDFLNKLKRAMKNSNARSNT